MDKKEYGRQGESRAVAFLGERGFEIVERNFRYRRAGEIDIVAMKGDLLIFVEVKSRSGSSYGGPLYSISAKKKKTLRFIAQQFLTAHPEYHSRDITCRFDFISIEGDRIEWVEDMFR